MYAACRRLRGMSSTEIGEALRRLAVDPIRLRFVRKIELAAEAERRTREAQAAVMLEWAADHYPQVIEQVA